MRRSFGIGNLVLALAFAIAAPALISAQPATAAGRVALVVGNSNYVHLPVLENPKNDAELIADTLEALGFTLTGGGPQLDLDKPQTDRMVQQFGRDIQGAEVALFYYAGHGVQINGRNFLIPVGANPQREADADFEMLDANLILRQMEGSGSSLNLLVLDACRNNPFGGRGMRSAGSGLAQMQAPEGTLISFATQPGNVALDGDGANSPYSRALAETMAQPGLDNFRVFNDVGLSVHKGTGGAQQPWLSASPISGEFYFAGRGDGSTPPPTQNAGRDDAGA
ncbi:MAG: caspase family protein, partial [Pseudomonadota bacterium]|nr:caspase family protein [Pseudomonadota bacterium]